MVGEARQLSFRAGLSWAEFYQYTPFQTTMIIRAWAKNKEDETQLAMLQAYHTANLSLYTNDPKSFPAKFSDWYEKGKPKKPQTEREASASILIWARKNGLKENSDGA